MSTRLTEADAERVGRKLADRIIRFNAEARGLPDTCRLVQCRRTGRCRGARLACEAALEAAVAAEQAASPDYDPAEGLKLWRQALEMAVTQLEAEAAAAPATPRRGRTKPNGHALAQKDVPSRETPGATFALGEPDGLGSSSAPAGRAGGRRRCPLKK